MAGIDPGTTTAIAVLDTDGRLLSLHSRKGMTRAAISRRMTESGTPVMVATDRRPAPSLAEKLASTFSARLVVPDESLSRREKNRLAKDMLREPGRDRPRTMRTNPRDRANQHEKDALAAAVYAFNTIKPTMARVEQRLRALGLSGDQDLSNFVRTRVILHGDHVKRAVDRFGQSIE